MRLNIVTTGILEGLRTVSREEGEEAGLALALHAESGIVAKNSRVCQWSWVGTLMVIAIATGHQR